MSSSLFPGQVDNLQYMTDVSASDASNVYTYQQLLLTSNLTPTQQQQLTSLTQQLTSAGKILSSDAWNHLVDAVTAVQSYFLNTVNSDIGNMENEFAAKVAKFSDQGAYNPATNYMDMNFVTWNGQSYICKQDNTVGIDPSHTSNWALVAQKGDKGDQGVPGAALSYVGTYNSASTYQQNQLVTYNGSTYICLQNNTTNILPTNTTYWTLFVTGATPIAQNSAPTNPTINQLWIDTTSSTNPLLKYWDGNQWDLVPSPATTSELGLVLMSATPQTGYPVAVSTVDPAYEQITGSKYIVPGTGISSTSGTNQQTLSLDIASSTQLGGVKSGEGLIIDSDGTLKNPWSVKGLSSVLSPSRQSFTRSTPAGQINGNQVASNVLRLEQGRFHKAPFIEEQTVNLVPNSGFNTVTGTAQVFADALTSYTGSTVPAPWTSQGGSWTFGASGATSGANASLMTAGNANWKPISGTGGQSLAVTKQLTFVTPSSMPVGGNDLAIVEFRIDSNNYYVAEVQETSNSFLISKNVNGVHTQLASVAFTPAVSSTYTITFALDNSGNLTAKLYSGQGTGGTLLQTLTHQDTDLKGGFLIGIGGDTGVVVSHAQVNAPFADGWTIAGDSRIAWALTSNAINGTYSMNGVGVAGVSGQAYPPTSSPISISPSTAYTLSVFSNSVNGGTSGANVSLAWYNGTSWISTPTTSATIKGNSLTQRLIATETSPSNANGVVPTISINDVGTYTFDMVQIEQKAYATTYIENNNASAGSTATRNADSLSYTLDKPLASRWSASMVLKPQQASTVVPASGNNARQLLYVNSLTGAWRYSVWFNQSAGIIRFSKSPDGGTTIYKFDVPVSFNAGDSVYVEVTDDPVTGDMTTWVQVNNGAITTGNFANTTQITDAQVVYIGCESFVGYEANGTIECILHELATGETITTDEVTALFGASDWGLGDYPSMIFDGGTYIDGEGNIVVGSNSNIAMNAPSGNNAWSQPIYFNSRDSSGNSHQGYFQQDPNGVLKANSGSGTNALAQVLSGGYKIQSGQINANCTGSAYTQVTVTLPVQLSSQAGVVIASSSTNGYNIRVTQAFLISTSQIVIEVYNENATVNATISWTLISN